MLSGLENPLHLLVILLVVLLIFGGKKLPELGRSLGSGMRQFKASVSGEELDQRPSIAATEPATVEQAAGEHEHTARPSVPA